METHCNIRLNEMGRIDDEIDDIFDEYERDINDTPIDNMNDDEARYYLYIRWSNKHEGKKPAAE